MRRIIWWIAGGLVLVSALALFVSWRAHRHTQQAPAPAAAAPPPSAPAVLNPVPPSAPAAEPLPPLNASDQPLLAAVGSDLGSSVSALLKPEMLIRHIVITVDNLPRKHAAVELRPTRAVAGSLVVNGDDQRSTLAPANFARYAPFVQALQGIDANRLAALYFRFYPLFQEQYQDLGYPNGYFNDRLIAAIDDLLSAPDSPADLVLVRPNVMYQFSDPKLEALSVGQKIMLRIGTANAAAVKAKLRELRELIAARSQPKSH